MNTEINLGEIPNIPNAITFARLGGVSLESYKYAQTGDVRHFIGAGAYYALDIADGIAARRLHQETDFGAMADPAVDKISVAELAAASIVVGKADTAPLVVLGALNASNMAASFVARARGTLEEGVTDEGKRSQFGMNTGFGLNVIGNHLRENKQPMVRKIGNILRHTGTALTLGSAATLGLKATVGYWRQALRPTE